MVKQHKRSTKELARSEPGWVYVVNNPRTGLHKIGSTEHPRDRLLSLSRRMKAECRVVHEILTNHRLRLERFVHAMFDEQHLGGEWFALTGPQLREVTAVSSVMYLDCDWRSTRTEYIADVLAKGYKSRLPSYPPQRLLSQKEIGAA